jgi:hypothetical protein
MGRGRVKNASLKGAIRREIVVQSRGLIRTLRAFRARGVAESDTRVISGVDLDCPVG